MFNKEDVDSWNELFPECKIRDSDLCHPTEAFLTKTLIFYLRSFGYKVEPPFPLNSDGHENSREKRHFLIMLTRHVDHVLKITDKSYTFTYLDLIRPTPKKTSHMLSILQNYLYYHNMYKTDIFKMANEAIETQQELKELIEMKKKELEQRKNRAEQIKRDTKILHSKLPTVKSDLKKLSNRNQKQKFELQSLQSELGKHTTKVEELKEQIRRLEPQVVSGQEANELKTQHLKLHQQSNMNEETLAASESYLKERKKQINTLEKIVEDVKLARNVLPDQMLIKYKTVSKALRESQKQVHTLEVKWGEQHQELEQKKMQLDQIEAQHITEKELVESEITSKLEEISEKEKLYTENSKLLKYKQEEEHALECLLEEQRDIKTYLQESIATLMEPYRKQA